MDILTAWLLPAICRPPSFVFFTLLLLASLRRCGTTSPSSLVGSSATAARTRALQRGRARRRVHARSRTQPNDSGEPADAGAL